MLQGRNIMRALTERRFRIAQFLATSSHRTAYIVVEKLRSWHKMVQASGIIIIVK